ncbi:MAG TPA: short-chain dehydrogenase/reductase [Methylomirabilota bacterium]|jgi:3-oxoacyl-[acyl-carrier protein] reductase|nr:short-chain dehydrogenase/reductase [Methylomirabilota bacterium]HYR41174.1 short-chain dehydrogenase/reductase [Methylomirabilota bacterium]
MDLELKGKTALITGGSKGIGLATARTMAAEGARVMICSRSADALGDAAGTIKRETGQTVETLAVDLSELAGVERTASEALTRLGRLDILVNNAGAIKGGDFLTTPDDEWMRGWSLKLLGYIRMARAIFPVMQKQGGGRIVNVVGAAARNPATTYMMGGTANAALINFTKALADLGARSNILVTAVSPGPVKTERWDTLQRQQAQAAGKDLESHLAELNKNYPLGRIATAEECADLICFLASARASFLSGIAITIDSGISRGVYL